MCEKTIPERLKDVENRINEVEKKIDRPLKEWIEISGKILLVILAIILALIGNRATSVYEEQKLKVLKVETVEKFFKHLISDDERLKRAAVGAISEIVDSAFATNIALWFGGERMRDSLVSEMALIGDLKAALQPGWGFKDAFSEKIKNSLVLIQSGDQAVMNGFFLTTDGLVVTIANTLRNLKPATIRVKTTGGTVVPVTIESLRDDVNLAFLRPHAKDFYTPLKLDPTATRLTASSKVVSLGWSLEQNWIQTFGHIYKYEPGEVVISRLSTPWLIGTPVFDNLGRFIGIVQRWDEGAVKAYVIPADVVISAYRRCLSEAISMSVPHDPVAISF